MISAFEQPNSPFNHVSSVLGWPCTLYSLSAACLPQQPPLTQRECGAAPAPPAPLPSCWLRLAVSSTTPVDQTAEEASSVCMQLADLFNQQYVPPVVLQSPFSCVAPNEYGPGLWTVTSFGLASSTTDAEQVCVCVCG